jgi:hypothetical protein
LVGAAQIEERSFVATGAPLDDGKLPGVVRGSFALGVGIEEGFLVAKDAPLDWRCGAAVEAEPDAFVMRDGQMRAWAAERSAAERDAFAWA